MLDFNELEETLADGDDEPLEARKADLPQLAPLLKCRKAQL